MNLYRHKVPAVPKGTLGNSGGIAMSSYVIQHSWPTTRERNPLRTMFGRPA